ncbi:hypothetical protein OHC33_006769 [Knufia fluminis]|uniref:Uncharacterized protein n=1 Tax=Knufia fluminis TaxID=191047 RepID=A0AAN8I6T7_9EURO|nr:hypothetical protein OHC33_006769 [Knufia fluminis]
MSNAPGTLRGATPKRAGLPFDTAMNSPSTSIPRPKLESQQSEMSGHSTISASRQKQSKRDEAIREKMAANLNRKKGTSSKLRHRKAPPGTVLALKPSPALQIKPNITVSEAAQMMAAKREDCVLVTDDDERIAGIFTAKDLAFRVVGAGLKAREVTIEQIMTKNPLCARTDTSATDALDLMVRKGFRHLPVMDENQDISGILDITKCFYEAMEKLERAYSSSRKLYDALEGVQSELGSSQPQQIIHYVEALRQKMSGPTLDSVLNGMPPTTVSVRTSVKEAAQLMKENHTTAVLVQDQGSITGIFTSKDVVLRVIAPGLDPATCSVVRVMTPHPDFAPSDMSIQSALRKMHDGHYLNLPVMNEGGEIVGMVDVLKLTYATLEQINTMGSDSSEGPAWNKFWLSMGDGDTESMVSAEGSHRPTTPGIRSIMESEVRPSIERGDSVMPNDSASHTGAAEDSPSDFHARSPIIEKEDPNDVPFPFKFKAPSGRVHRLQVVANEGYEHLVDQVKSKLGKELETVGGDSLAMSYLDNEGDTVSITTDEDLKDAITMAISSQREKVDLFVHDPSQPPIPATQNPAPQPPTPETSSKAMVDGSEPASRQRSPDARSSFAQNKQQQQAPEVLPGVPNELLLPGAVLTLAAVIVVVFAIGRASKN